MGPDVRERLSEADKASAEAGQTSLRRAGPGGLTAFPGLPVLLGLFPGKALLRSFLGDKSRKL